MTREERGFAIALVISLGVHAVFTGLFFSIPENEPEEKVVIYTVRILETPARPKVRTLALSTSAISALKLQSPSLSLKPRTNSQPAPPDLAEADLIPKTGQAFKSLPVPKASPSFKGLPLPKASPSLLPPPPLSSKSPRRDFRTPSTEGVKARPKAALPGPRSVFPKLPETPKRDSSTVPLKTSRTAVVRPTVVRPKVPALPSTRNPASRPRSKNLMERTRERVQTLKLDIEAAPPQPRKSPNSPSPEERNLVSLRRYSRSVARAVKKDYTFPGSGGFKSGLRARMRLALNRDGSVRSIEILESSGNPTFDQIVCRSKIFKARMPPLPKGIPDDPLILMITCKP